MTWASSCAFATDHGVEFRPQDRRGRARGPRGRTRLSSRPISASKARQSCGVSGADRPLLEVRGLSSAMARASSSRAIDLSVPKGAIVCLIGANGAGKTTMLRGLSGLVKVRAGSIRFMQEDITHTPAHRIARAGIAPCAGGPPDLRRHDGRRESPDGSFFRAEQGGAGAPTRIARSPAFPALARGCGNAPACFPAASSRCWRSAAR